MVKININVVVYLPGLLAGYVPVRQPIEKVLRIIEYHYPELATQFI
jgi:hypothetical protein